MRFPTHSLALYFALCFAWSWTAWIASIALASARAPLLVVGSFGPALAAAIVLGARGTLRPTLRRMLIWRCPPWTWAYAVGLAATGCFAPFALQVLAFSTLYTRLHLATGGSLLVAHVFHAASNSAIGLFGVLPDARGGDPAALHIGLGLPCAPSALTAVRMRHAREPTSRSPAGVRR